MGRWSRARTTIGLDIGSAFVKLVEVDHAGEAPRVVRVHVRPIPPDAIVEGEVMDPGLLAESLQGLWEEAGLRSREVVAAVGGRDVIVKKISLGRQGIQEARDVLAIEAEKHIPFDVRSVELDFQILNPEGSGPEMDVLLVAAKREGVGDTLALLHRSDLTATILDVGAFALHNALERNHPEALLGVVALVNVGHERTSVNILEDGVPALSRELSFGTRQIRESLQREEDLTADEAEGILRGEGSHPHFDRMIQAGADEVAQGVERAAAFLLAQQFGTRLGAVYLAGGGTLIEGFPEALARRLSLEVRTVNPFRKVSLAPDALRDPGLERVGPMLLLALGLALRSTRD
jgi:type IV pilus assembly protein PilM